MWKKPYAYSAPILAQLRFRNGNGAQEVTIGRLHVAIMGCV